MVASFCGGGFDVGFEEDSASGGSGEGNDGAAATISELLTQGAAINAQTDRTGETSLHLAARYARADAAKRLLDAGAEPNAKDNTGRTPLHAAVAADAQGVFQVNTNPSDQGKGLTGARERFFSWGGGKNVDMPSDCQNLGGGTGISIPLRQKVGGAIAPLAPPAPAPLGPQVTKATLNINGYYWDSWRFQVQALRKALGLGTSRS